MYKSDSHPLASINRYRIEDRMMRYSVLVPRLYNLCKSMGFEVGKILPSCAFCSDESQGFPVILIAKHFGTFPFNHGQAGGIVATDRHAPHADHGKDMVIIQASHVGYDPEAGAFGVYRRLQTENRKVTPSCGKIESVLDWYRSEYRFARENIFLSRQDDEWLVVIDNQLLNPDRDEGLYLNLDQLIELDAQGQALPRDAFSTSRCYSAAQALLDRLEGLSVRPGEQLAIGEYLAPHCFYFKRYVEGDEEGRRHLEQNLLPVMPWILVSRNPMLVAAKINTQVEYDRAFRTIIREKGYRNKRVFYVAGLNIDISPQPGQLFPLTKFVPWAACMQQPDGSRRNFEQDELFRMLDEQSTENPDEIDLESAIRTMSQAQEIHLSIDT